MGTDDTDDKPTGGAGRETFETVPPELRPFYVPGPSEKIDISKNPRLAAALAVIEMLDEMDEEERREAAESGSTKAHIASVAIPQATRPRADPPAARVEISAPGQENKPPAEGQVIRLDRARLAERKAEQAEAKQAMSMVDIAQPARPKSDPPPPRVEVAVLPQVVVRKADEATAPKDDEPTLRKEKPAPSPWTKQTADDVRASALPSSLRPRELPATEGDAPASTRPTSEKPAGVPVHDRTKTTAAIAVAILVVAAVIGARAFRSGRSPEGAAPTATMTAAAPPTAAAAPMPTPSASVDEQAPPAASGTSSAGAAPAPSSVPASTPRPKRRGALDDPYDAAAPSQVVTAPQMPTAMPSVTPTVAPSAPKAPSTATSEKPVYD